MTNCHLIAPLVFQSFDGHFNRVQVAAQKPAPNIKLSSFFPPSNATSFTRIGFHDSLSCSHYHGELKLCSFPPLPFLSFIFSITAPDTVYHLNMHNYCYVNLRMHKHFLILHNMLKPQFQFHLLHQRKVSREPTFRVINARVNTDQDKRKLFSGSVVPNWEIHWPFCVWGAWSTTP